MNLLIVESPAKAKTIQGYLSDLDGQWKVLATGGHIVDLPKNRHGIKQQGDHFIPEWEVIKEKKEGLKKIKEWTGKASSIYVGSDDDREGEAIASSVIKYAGIKAPKRIVFSEITKKAIIAAIQQGERPLDRARVLAQEARRLVDREIGYPLSEVIRWSFASTKSNKKPKGVGRIISPALHILSENEKTIEAFVPTPYSIIYADYTYKGLQFRLTNKVKFTEEHEHELEATLNHFQMFDHAIYNYKRKTKEVPPYPPLITSRLQRCAFYLFGLDPKKTMAIAQQLYEGVDLGGGQRQGLITYPRTDSFTISKEACSDIITLLSNYYESDYVLSSPRQFSNKENAQAAHEAIRPVSFEKKFWPRHLKEKLTKEQYEVYRLIWGRTLATQMSNAIYDVSELEIDVEGNRLKARANQQLFDGWEKIDGHEANISEKSEEEDFRNREVRIPEMSIGDIIEPIEISTVELSTKCPPRYGVGRFITLIDNKGIARPSTIDSILPSLEQKGYIKTLKGMLYVTDLGKAVDQWTNEHVSWLADVDLARQFEEELDEIEQGCAIKDSVISEYVEKVKEVKKELGFVERSERKPTNEQLIYAMTLAEKQNIEIPSDALENQLKLSDFINQHKPETHYIGKCPVCKSKVAETEKSYRCISKECTFYLVKSSVSRFIERFKINADPQTFTTELFKRKKNGCAGLSGREGKTFNAYIGLKNDEKYGWQAGILGYAKNIEKPIFQGEGS